jgi:hypothetical protein
VHAFKRDVAGGRGRGLLARRRFGGSSRLVVERWGRLWGHDRLLVNLG